MHKKIVFVVSALIILSSSNVFAQNAVPPYPNTQATGEGNMHPPYNLQVRPTIQALRQQNQTDRQNIRQDLRQEMQTKMQDFKAKIGQIKDVHKQTIVENINDRIATSNATLTSRFSDTLNKMTGIINNIKTQSTTLKGQGKDTTALDAAISSAETAITTAQTAITTQQTNTYTAAITTDTTLKTPMNQMVLQFRTDIQTVYQAVLAAKQAVLKAYVELAKLKGAPLPPTATSSATTQ